MTAATAVLGLLLALALYSLRQNIDDYGDRETVLKDGGKENMVLGGEKTDRAVF